MKITKNKGPNKEPWDTPDRMVLHIELIPSITTLQYRVKKNIGRKKKLKAAHAYFRREIFWREN